MSAISSHPVAKEDVALIVDADVPAAGVQAELRAGAGPLCESVRLFDTYTGPQVGDGKKSLAFALRFRAPDRTLTDAEAAAARDAAVAGGGCLRGRPAHRLNRPAGAVGNCRVATASRGASLPNSTVSEKGWRGRGRTGHGVAVSSTTGPSRVSGSTVSWTAEKPADPTDARSASSDGSPLEAIFRPR